MKEISALFNINMAEVNIIDNKKKIIKIDSAFIITIFFYK